MAQRKYKSNDKKKKEIDQLTEMRNSEVENHFHSQDQLKEYLSFMSKFYNYSFRNSTLIQKQFRGAQAVGSFKFWKDKGFSVQKGEKGIKILAPYKFKTFEKQDSKGNKYDKPVKYATKEEKADIDNKKIPVKEKMAYTTGHVFDISQTNATEKDLPYIFPNKWIDGEVKNYDEVRESLNKLAEKMNVNIHDEPLRELGASKGVYFEYTQRNSKGEMENKKGIELNPRNDQKHNVKTLVHELAHAKLHNSENKNSLELNHNEKEFQAEMTAFTVCSHFNIDTSDYSLNYLHNYTKDHEQINDKMQLLEEVKDTSYEFITHLENDLVEEKELEEVTTDTRSEELQQEYKDTQIIVNDDVVTIGSLSFEEFKGYFQDEHNRNVLDNDEYKDMAKQEVIQSFNQTSDQWNDNKETVKMVDETLEEPHAYVVSSESNIGRDLKTLEEMDKALAEQNIESITTDGQSKTNINYVIPGNDTVEVKSVAPIELGNADYTDLPTHVKNNHQELVDITPETNRSDMYEPEKLSDKLKETYHQNLELKGRHINDEEQIEKSDKQVQTVERLATKTGALSEDEITSIKQGVNEQYSEQKEYRDVVNNVESLKGQYETYQEHVKAESVGELTEEKVINRMDAENQYKDMKEQVKEHSSTPHEVIEKMETDTAATYKKQSSKEQEKDSPFEKQKPVKNKEQGMGM